MGVWIETKSKQKDVDSYESHPAWVCGLKQVWTPPLLPLLRSHPAWVCGLKLNTNLEADNSQAVTPCVGVWIETQVYLQSDSQAVSHPAWVCGLKHPDFSSVDTALAVTPCVGVWIETFCSRNRRQVIDVTPCVGVWIETKDKALRDYYKCHTLRGCVD